MTQITQAMVLQQLRTVQEPCSLLMRNPMDICEMGLVDGLEIADGRVSITLCLTDPGCVHFRGMRQYIQDAVMQIPGVREVEVRQTVDKLWTPDRKGQVLPQSSSC